ncbi:MAG TPA: SIR2 family protein [Thermoanaerobaculia bacterium]|nr:SIR2 family protein [Thermoanaerobaculia bacterium]
MKSSHPQQAWLDRSNQQTLYHLERQGRTGPGVVPFLGAGISMTYGLKSWKDLLLSAAPPRLLPAIEEELGKGNYEEAAEMLRQEFGADGFQNMIAAAAGDSNLAAFDFRTGMVALLPLLASGPVVTTNFDRVLERAFEAQGAPFESVISGPRPDLIVDALHGHRRVLIKLHGDWQDRVGRTFAKSDYDANYGTEQPKKKRELLYGAERLLFSSCSLLFIGASLGPDRTVELLRGTYDNYAGIRHFTIMQAPAEQKKLEEKEKHLSTCGILPLWYHAETGDDHVREVERLVADIVERISVRTLPRPVAGPAAEELPPSSSAAPPTPVSPPEDGRVPTGAHLDRVARLIEDGRLTFFLGSAIHAPTRLMAKEFYAELARIFECEALREEPFAVAQYIADRHGREDLYAQIRKVFENTALPPRATHELFAAWTQLGKKLPFPMIFTTNYDDVLESRLAQAGLPYHLFSYQADGAHRGLFYHRDADGGLRIIERPHNIQCSHDGFIVVKLNGGFDRRRRIPESYVTTRLDFWDLAARIPYVLPANVRAKLSANRLLFLGHGLAAADVESLVRFAHKDHPGPRSWAVALGKQDGVEYWRQCGVEILDLDVNLYVNELFKRLGGKGRI